MKISGLQKMTLLDYPGKVACTVFLQGCNFRCPFCHNSDLLGGVAPDEIPVETLMAFLKKRVGLLDAVCITGGEPTLQNDLDALLEQIKSLGYLVKLAWEVEPTSVTFACWPESVWVKENVKEESVVSQDGAFYAKPSGYVYEIVATWDDTGKGYHGSANYYVYIVGGEDHNHQAAATAQTVDNPVTGYCGNTQTTLYIDGKEYSFMYGYSVTLTDILIILDYDPMRVCRCRPEYTVDTEFGKGYGINLTAGYARCDKGQADLTQEQIDTIAAIIEWAKTTNCEYPIGN